MIISLKGILKECFSFSVNVSATLKFLLAFGGLSEGTEALGFSEGTWTLGHLRHLGTWVFRALRHLGHSGTWVLGTCAFRAIGHLGTQGTLPRLHDILQKSFFVMR